MADPLSIIGTISVAAGAAAKLGTIVSNIKDAPAEVKSLEANVGTLLSVLASAGMLCQDARLTDAARPLVTTVEQCVTNCEGAIAPLQAALKPVAAIGAGNGVVAKLQGNWKRMLWTWKRDDVMSMKKRLADAMASLNIAMAVLNGFISGKGQDEILKEMAVGFESLRRDIRHADATRDLRRKLEDDLETVTAATTEAGDTNRDLVARWIHVTDHTVAESFNMDDGEINALLVADNADRVSELLDSGILKLDESLSGRPLLHRCAVYNSPKIAAILLENGAPTETRDIDGEMPLVICVKKQSWDVAVLILEHGCSLKPLLADFFKHLDDNFEDLSPLKPTLRALAKRLRGSENGPFLVHQAVDRQEPKYLSLLLEVGFDANASEYGCLPIHVASARNHAPCAAILFQHGADPNAAIPTTAKEFLRRSVPYHALIMDLMAKNHFVPMWLCSNSFLEQGTETFRLVLKHGGDPNATIPPLNNNILIPFCSRAFTAVAQMALEAGADPNHQNNRGMSAMYWAVPCGNIPLVNLLLDHGADPELKTHEDLGALTVLHRAVAVDNFDAAEVLVRRGARLDSRNGAGETPLEMAEKQGKTRIAQLLRDRETKALET